MSRKWYLACGKRAIDLLVALPLIVLLAPLFGVVAALVRWRLGSPVLFCQQRAGLHGNLFTIFKFRTMNDRRDATGQLLPDCDRLTALGRFLRSTSLDELPQLWNIVRGEMSFIGPRPLLPQYLGRYSAEQNRRHEVRPGITGLAQVCGRNAIDWETRFRLDILYVDHADLGIDLTIVLKTILCVLRRCDISAAGQATMSPFTGNHVGQTFLSANLDGSQTGGRISDRQECLPHGTIVLGAGGHAAVVIATLQAAGKTVAAVYDDNPGLIGQSLLGIPILGPLAAAEANPTRPAIVALGDNEIRENVAKRSRHPWISAVHPSAVVHKSVELGAGSVVFAGAIVQPRARIGEHVIVNTAASVDHDCVLEDFVSVGPGAHLAGGVHVGRGTAIGIGACVIPGITIGAGAVVGAGTVVIDDLPDNVVAVGSPARILCNTVGVQPLGCFRPEQDEVGIPTAEAA